MESMNQDKIELMHTQEKLRTVGGVGGYSGNVGRAEERAEVEPCQYQP